MQYSRQRRVSAESRHVYDYIKNLILSARKMMDRCSPWLFPLGWTTSALLGTHMGIQYWVSMVACVLQSYGGGSTADGEP